jgi:3-oxoacyl-[acyl-carrier-protein] synthase-3
MKRNNLTNQDVDWLVPHQANKRIIVLSQMNLEESKVLMNIEKYMEIPSKLPLVLYDFEHLFKKEIQLFWLLLEEVSWGSVYLKWAYDKK